MNKIVLMINDENGRRLLADKLSTKKYYFIDNFDQLAIFLGANPTALVFIDLYNRDWSFDVLEKIHQNFREAKVVLLSNYPNFQEGYKALKYEIKGYTNILISKTNLMQLIKQISNGNTWFLPEFIASLIAMVSISDYVQERVDLSVLSERELTAARYVSMSLINKEIATKMKISERTVKAHIKSCFEKLGITDRITLALVIKESKGLDN